MRQMTRMRQLIKCLGLDETGKTCLIGLMKTLTQSQLRDLLLSLHGATPLTISAMTEIKLAKYGRVAKFSRVNGISGFSYKDSVRRAGEPEFTPQPRQWGERLGKNGHLVHHKGRLYLNMKVEKVREPVYLVREGTLLKTIRPTEDELPKRDDRSVITRDYQLDHLKRISIGGEKYRIIEA